MQGDYPLLADLIVIFHFLYVLFAVGGQIVIIFGGFLRWRWIRNLTFRVVHLISVVLVAVEAFIGVLCPLTVWEYNLRRLSGQTVDRDISFIARLVRTVIFYDFPSWVFTLMHITFGFIVILTFVLIPPRFHRQAIKEQQPNP